MDDLNMFGTSCKLSGLKSEKAKKLTDDELDRTLKENRTRNPKVENLFRFLDEVDSTNAKLADNLADSINITKIQKDLSILRQENCEISKNQENKIKQLREQKLKLDEQVQRHQKMIDEVMLDKVALNKRCEELLAESLTRDIKYKNNLKAMEERHAEELRRAKELLKAAKAEWATSKEKVKKVPSVKCIENELLALNDRFAQKEFELQRNHEQEIRLVRQELEKAKATELQILKEKLTAEKETALEAERQRLHEQHQEEITKMTKLHESQKQSWSKYFADRVKDCEVREAHARSVLDQEIERIKQDTARQIEAVNEQHQFELVIEKDKMKLQMQKFTVDVEKKLEVVMQKKEIEIRKQVISERDVQIEKITEEFQRVLSREKSNYLTNIAELVEKNKITVNNYEKQLTESNDLKISTHKVLQSLQIELNDITQQLQTKNMEYKNLQAEKCSKEREINDLKQQAEFNQLAHSQAIEEVGERVKQTLASKDQQITLLSEKVKALQAAFKEQLNNASPI